MMLASYMLLHVYHNKLTVALKRKPIRRIPDAVVAIPLFPTVCRAQKHESERAVRITTWLMVS